jgi:hypothetical protein
MSLGVWYFATKGIILKRVLYLQILDMPAVVNAKLSQRTLRSYWSIPFTQELSGKNHSHVRLLPTYIIAFSKH